MDEYLMASVSDLRDRLAQVFEVRVAEFHAADARGDYERCLILQKQIDVDHTLIKALATYVWSSSRT